MIMKYDDKIDKMQMQFCERIQQNKDLQDFLYATYFMLGAYKSVLVDYKSNIIAKMNK